MANTTLMKFFEHNNWANFQLIEVCAALSDIQLDAEPDATTKGSIRLTLHHMMASQQSYWTQLAGVPPVFDWHSPPDFEAIREAAKITGEGLLALASDESGKLETTFHHDGYAIEPWVVMLQAINHATEHREQIKSLLSKLGLTPPRIDGWMYGRITHALVELPDETP